MNKQIKPRNNLKPSRILIVMAMVASCHIVTPAAQSPDSEIFRGSVLQVHTPLHFPPGTPIYALGPTRVPVVCVRKGGSLPMEGFVASIHFSKRVECSTYIFRRELGFLLPESLKSCPGCSICYLGLPPIEQPVNGEPRPASEQTPSWPVITVRKKDMFRFLQGDQVVMRLRNVNIKGNEDRAFPVAGIAAEFSAELLNNFNQAAGDVQGIGPGPAVLPAPPPAPPRKKPSPPARPIADFCGSDDESDPVQSPPPNRRKLPVAPAAVSPLLLRERTPSGFASQVRDAMDSHRFDLFVDMPQSEMSPLVRHLRELRRLRMEAPGTNTSAIYQLRIGSGRTFLVSLKEHTPVIETLRDWSDLPIDESDPYGLTPVSEFQTRAKAHLAQFAGQPWTDILSTDPKAYELKNKITFVTSPDPLRINLYLGIIGNRAQTNALRQKVRKLLAARRARQGIIDPTIEVRHPNGSVTFVNDMEILFQHFDWLDSQPPQELIVTAP